MSATEALIADLERTRDEMLSYFSLGESDLSRAYGPGKWSVRYLLHHITDSELVYLERLRRAISERHVLVWYCDQDAWAQGLDYSTRPLESSRILFTAVRLAVITDARRHYERDGSIEFVHSRTGLRTVKDQFDEVAAHNEHHLSQIRIALNS